MRIDRIHSKFDRPVFRQQANQTARLEIVGDQKSRRQANADALQRGSTQRFAAIGDQIARDPHRCGRTFAVDEAPLIIGIKRMADAVAVRELGQLLRPPVSFEITR